MEIVLTGLVAGGVVGSLLGAFFLTVVVNRDKDRWM